MIADAAPRIECVFRWRALSSSGADEASNVMDMSTTVISGHQLQAQDIVRARKFGDGRSSTYVVDEVLGLRHGGDIMAVYAHDCSSSMHSSEYLLMVGASIRVVGRVRLRVF